MKKKGEKQYISIPLSFPNMSCSPESLRCRTSMIPETARPGNENVHRSYRVEQSRTSREQKTKLRDVRLDFPTDLILLVARLRGSGLSFAVRQTAISDGPTRISVSRPLVSSAQPTLGLTPNPSCPLTLSRHHAQVLLTSPSLNSQWTGRGL